jgi:glucose dehydrogenase
VVRISHQALVLEHLAIVATVAMAGQSDTGARIIQADAAPGNWLTIGFNYAETRFSPLAQIDTANAASGRPA